MATIKLDIVTAERRTFSDDVSMVVVPGIDGQLGILPHHAPLMSMIQTGELIIKKDKEEFYLFIDGGFVEIRPDRIIILADACEHCTEIDIERAETAKRRAEESLKSISADIDHFRAEAALRRSLMRLKVAERIQRRTR
jgi:F-type H+-transporting ATPase subunit epsilon